MQFPKSHLILLGVLSFGMCSFVVAKFNDDSSQDRFTQESVLLELPHRTEEDSQGVVDMALEATGLPQELAVVEDVPEPEDVIPENWREIKTVVKPGDSLALIFKRNSLTARDVHEVTSAEPLGPRLRNIFPGHEITFAINEAGELMRLTYSTGPLDTLRYDRLGERFTAQQITTEPERLTTYKHGVIDHSLFVASQRAGLSDRVTMRLAQIFQWDVDFVLDIRPGDSFYVVYEELYHNGERLGDGNILAAEFINQGTHYRALRYADADGDYDYYAPTGDSMRKAFLRAPVEFSRISSNFNLRRVHPLFKTVRPHRGIDYSAPQGTPILAAGDGRVMKASRTKANGNYVVIQHGEQFVTKYLHLSKFARGVRGGSKVTQGQTIGYVGATGWATAPHLHYEFLVNGVHKNPRTVSLPDARPIGDTEMEKFQSATQAVSALLDNYKSEVSVVSAR